MDSGVGLRGTAAQKKTDQMGRLGSCDRVGTAILRCLITAASIPVARAFEYVRYASTLSYFMEGVQSVLKTSLLAL